MKDKLKGKAEELKGKATGSKTTELKGKGRQVVGGAKQAAKSAAWDAEHPREGAPMNLRRSGEDFADRVNRQVEKQTVRLTKQVAMLLDRAAGLADRVDSMQGELSRRVVPAPKPRRRGPVLFLVMGAMGGYAAAYFLDPERGRARRAELARQFNGLGREATRAAQRAAMLASDRAAGIRSRVVGPDNSDPDDLTLLDRVESEVFRDPTIPKGDINVMVVDGKAVLRGQVDEQQIGAIEAAVRKVVGVRDVENLLHVPGTAAPNKAAARAAGSSVGPTPSPN